MTMTMIVALLVCLFLWFGDAIYLTGMSDLDQQALPFEAYDVMLTDLDYSRIANISLADLGFEHDSPTADPPLFPIAGIVGAWPTVGRVFAKVVLQHKKKRIQSMVVVDTTAPGVYLCDQTLQALGIHADADYANVVVHGELTAVWRSARHFRDVNVLGSSYLLENKLRLVVDYRSRRAKLETTTPITSEDELSEL